MSRSVLTRRALLVAAALATSTRGAEAGAGGHPARPTGVDLDPLLQLTTQAGQRLDRKALRRRPFIVVFGYTRCPVVCPTTMHELSVHLAGLGPKGDRLGVFWVTIDPERDTVETLNLYLSDFDPRIVGLTGTPEAVKAAADAFGALYSKSPSESEGEYSMNHSYLLYLVDRYGMLAATVEYGAPAERLAELSQKLLLQ